MIMMMTLASAATAAALQASVATPRSALGTCVEEAMKKAESEKVKADAFGDQLRSTCGSAADRLKNALVTFDTKNGIKRAQALEDAQMEIDDTIDSATQTYKRLNTETAAAQ